MIHIVIGTRAQLIKMCPLMYELEKKGIEYNFIFVAQHKETIYEMLDQFQVKTPDIVIGDIGKDLDKTSETFFWSIKVMLEMIFRKNKIFRGDHDGVVVVHGDALPLFFGAFAGKLQRLKVYAVEGGLRSFDYFNPFPEEIVRFVTSHLHLVDVFFCQDDRAMKNAESYPGEKVLTYGNTIKDALLMPQKLGHKPPRGLVPDDKYILITLHRYENLSNSERMDFIVEKLIELSKRFKVLILLHPPTRKVLIERGDFEKLEKTEGIRLVPRQDFFNFNHLFRNCEFIISDGGSNQEESSYLGIPCLLFRTETERKEGLGENVVLSKFDEEVIDEFINNYSSYRKKPIDSKRSPTEIVLDYLLKEN